MVMCIVTFFFKQKTAYEMRISDWSSDVCSSDLIGVLDDEHGHSGIGDMRLSAARCDDSGACLRTMLQLPTGDADHLMGGGLGLAAWYEQAFAFSALGPRTEGHTSALQSLMRSSYAVFCLTNKETAADNRP